jgi:hypothetical protein
MKTLFALAAIVSLSTSAFAADGHISQRSLLKMGLPGLTRLSDEQGMAIRGTAPSMGEIVITKMVDKAAVPIFHTTTVTPKPSFTITVTIVGGPR